jgi:hypothetical protein
MTEKEKAAIRQLDEIDGGDPKLAHDEADDIILSLVSVEVLNAYSRLIRRCAWWVTA